MQSCDRYYYALIILSLQCTVKDNSELGWQDVMVMPSTPHTTVPVTTRYPRGLAAFKVVQAHALNHLVLTTNVSE